MYILILQITKLNLLTANIDNIKLFVQRSTNNILTHPYILCPSAETAYTTPNGNKTAAALSKHCNASSHESVQLLWITDIKVIHLNSK